MEPNGDAIDAAAEGASLELYGVSALAKLLGLHAGKGIDRV